MVGAWGGQGGAADVVVMAMLRLRASRRLAELGWRTVLQAANSLAL